MYIVHVFILSLCYDKIYMCVYHDSLQTIGVCPLYELYFLQLVFNQLHIKKGPENTYFIQFHRTVIIKELNLLLIKQKNDTNNYRFDSEYYVNDKNRDCIDDEATTIDDDYSSYDDYLS